MEEAEAALFPHDVARDVVEADLRRRDPDTYADIHRRLRGYFVVADAVRTFITSTAGHPR